MWKINMKLMGVDKKVYQREWRSSHKELIAGYARNRRRDHGDKVRAYARKWNNEHRTEVNKQKRERGAKLKEEVLKHYNPNGKPECSTCGEKELVVLTLSHLSSIPELPSEYSQKLYRLLKRRNYPRVQLLTECMNCNVRRDYWGKRKR